MSRKRKTVEPQPYVDPAKIKRRKGKAWMRAVKRGRVLGAKREDEE